MSRATVKRGNLVSYERMAEIISDGDEAASKDMRQLLRRWRQRGHILPVRDDLTVFDWTEVRPVIAERLGKPADEWEDVEVVQQG